MNKIADLFSHTGDGACIIDENQRIISWNPAATAMLGYSREEALGQLCWELLLGNTRDNKPFCKPTCTIRQRLDEGGATTSMDLWVRHRSGERVLVNISTIPISPITNDGKPGMLVHLWRLIEPPLAQKRLRIHLLGATMVTRSDDTTVCGGMWNRVKVRALLAYLALQGGQPVSRERLIDVLWPELDYKAALHNLNTTVYNLRHSLEPDLKKASDSSYIAYQSGQYYLIDADRHWLDVRAFEADIRQARTVINSLDKIDAYKTAVALYRDDYLADLDATGVQSTSEQVRYQLLYLTAMEELGQALEALDQDQEAEIWYERVLAADACRESVARRLVRLLLRQGRRMDALMRIQQLATMLENELDAVLSVETSDLMAQIRLTA
ncbi:MAG: PAS domain S-box protein [Anaerolinea sp.]|nr:PAS domain S-box protein [Anaerolinea sp.]